MSYVLPVSGQSSDTICPKIDTYRKLVIAAEQKKILEEQVVILNRRISEKDSVIALLRFNDETNEQVIQTYKDELAVMKDQKDILFSAIKGSEKIIRKLKRKVFWTSAAGVAGMGTMAFLLLTK